MKKYIFTILIIGITLASVMIYSSIKVQNSNTKNFADSGYILKSEDNETTQNIERFYFNANETYKIRYGEKVVFNDTNGEEVVTSKENFLHYTNGSMSALTNGVILDLNQIDEENITYYNIFAGNTLKKQNNSYNVQNANNMLKFDNLIWKISSQKYLITGNPIEVVFNDGTTKSINGYVEVEYKDNEIVKIYNQEVTYQTISSNVYLSLNNNIKLNLSTKIISKDNKNKMSLENMVINSEDNVQIVDLDSYKEENKKETEIEPEQNENTTEENITNNIDNSSNINNNDGKIENLIEAIKNSQNQNNNTTNNSTININNNTINNGGTNNNPTPDNPSQGGDETLPSDDKNDGDNEKTDDDKKGDDNEVDSGENEYVDVPNINEPKFIIDYFEVNSISINSKISVKDEDELLTGDINIKIIKNDNGKTIYETVENYGVSNIDISVSTLLPNTEYTLAIEATYKVEETTYTKYFIYKMFRTEFMGIDFTKDYITNNKLSIEAVFEKDAKIQSFDLVLLNENGDVLQTNTVTKPLTEQSTIVEFTDLTPNTVYNVKATNVLYNDQVITNGFETSKKFKTLKNKPLINGVEFEIDKRTAEFTLKSKEIQDINHGITSYRYEIYDTRQDLIPENIITTVTLERYEAVKVKVDNVTLKRGVPYTFKIVCTFDDNEKIVEYDSEYSNIMMLEGVDFPTVKFTEDEITFERIKGSLIIEDPGNTISLTGNKFTVVYTDSVGMTNKFTASGSYIIPVDVNNLRANETYKFSIYTKVDLQDNNKPIDECYIGGAIVQTKLPNNLVAKFSENESDVTTPFSIQFSLGKSTSTENELELDTLSGITFNLYAGQDASGTPIRTVKVLDKNTEPYESDLKDNYYNKDVTINPAFFGAKNSDFKEKYYTIVVTDAFDYTQYPNNIPILDNVYSMKTNGWMPELPVDNPIDITVLRNRDKDKRSDLEPSTITGYSIKAVYDNSQLYAKKIVYKVFDATTNKVIKEVELEVGKDGTIPSYTFDVLDGTPLETEDSDALRRGNSYYFTYEAYLDMNGDGTPETKYPYSTGEEEIVLKSKTVLPEKQEATFIMYPSVSNANGITYKYKYSDIDNTITINSMFAYINSKLRDTKEIQLGEEDGKFQEITFTNLTTGDLNLNIKRTLDKTQEPTERNIVSHLFEGEIGIQEVKAKVEVSNNRVVVSLVNVSEKYNRIATLSVKFIAEDIVIEKKFKDPKDNMVIFSLNELESLINKTVKVEVYAYYDSGIMGFDIDAKYIALEKAHLSNTTKYYYTFNDKNQLIETASLNGNIYTATRADTVLNIIRVADESTAKVDLVYSQTGFRYNYNTIIQKRIDELILQPEGSSTISFDKIIPGISMKGTEENSLDLITDLSSAKFRAKIEKANSTVIKNDIIYIDLYKTDENAKNEKLVKTIEKKLSDFSSYIEITDLEPKTYYYLDFRAVLVKANGEEETKLFDIDQQILGRHYYFSTLANVGISNVKVEYSPESYTEKYINISYKLDKILGYQKIEYELYKYNEEKGKYEIFMDGLEDTLIKKEMLKKIPVNSSTNIEFNKQYKIIIKPLAIYQDENGNEKKTEVGTIEHEFRLDELQMPIIAIRASRDANRTLKFRVTVYDTSKILVNGTYRIALFCDGEEITPDEYKNDYTINTINNLFEVADTDRNKEYSIRIYGQVDVNADGQTIEPIEKEYKINKLNESGIEIGKVTAIRNNANEQKIDLVFNDSYKLLEIEQMRYSIYNTNGYAINNTVEFIPKEIRQENDVYYLITLDEKIETGGVYYIEVQFLKDGEIVDDASLEYTYIE